MRKRVVIHAGFHKTGSSALQAFFSENVAVLAGAGIDYPYPEPGAVVQSGGCSGNLVQVLYRDGFMSLESLFEQDFSLVGRSFADRLVAIVDSSAHDTVLFSGEMLGSLPKETRFAVIHGLKAHHDVEVVCFVRDPFDFVYSAWRQLAKLVRGPGQLTDWLIAEPRLLTDWLIAKPRMLSMLDTFSDFEALGVPLHVIRYETHRDNIAKAFMEAAGLPSTIGGALVSTEREANRSLTGSEALMATILARELRSDFVATFVRAALARPGRRDAGFYDRGIHQTLLERYSAAVAAINARLPEAERLSTEVRDQPDQPIAMDPADLELFLHLLRQHPPPTTGMRVRSRLHALVQGFRRRVGLDPTLPPDFDGAAYLFHNPDVEAAGADAAQHYLAYGHAEGRRYRFN